MNTFDHFVGRELESVTHDTQCHEWIFIFTDKIALQVSAPWRITIGSSIALGFEDHGQMFGLPAPLDIQKQLCDFVIGRRVESVSATEHGDLTVRLGEGSALEIFNSSAGYEGWVLNGPGGQWVVAQGGGRIVEAPKDL